VRERYWEIDALRGIAVIAMILYHFSYDLAYFGLFDVVFFRSGIGLNAARLIGGSFIFLAGLSLTLSYSRALARALGRSLFPKYLARGLRIFSYGLAITFLTWIFLPNEIIVFGILHLIGVSIILAYPLLKYRYVNLFLGLFIIAVGVYMRIEALSSESPWLLPFGVVPENLVMPDYRPLLPWFGVVLLGVFAGNVVYGGGKRPALFAQKAPAAARPLLPLGRNSLFIYLIHQPILLALLAAFGVIPKY
jgi:uncharacterized membrane protein